MESSSEIRGGRIALSCVLFFLIAMSTSRITLLIHELLGHAAPALAFHVPIREVHLFLFGGGYVSYGEAPQLSRAQGLIISLGGIALEFVLAGAALLLSRFSIRRPMLRFILISFAAINCLHALFYLSVGLHYGSGDGWDLYHMLGADRPWVLLPLGLLLLGFGYGFSVRIASQLREWHGHPPLLRFLLLCGASVGFAGLLHMGLTYGEWRLAQRSTYRHLMSSESDRKVERELQEYKAQVEQQTGRPAPDAEVHKTKTKLQRRHRPFPLRWVLLAGLCGAFTLGAIRVAAIRTPPPTYSMIAWRDLKGPALLCLFSLLLVAVLKFVIFSGSSP